MAGDLGISFQFLQDGSTNQQYSLAHRQEFSQRTKLSANINYVTNTTVQRNTTFNPFVAVQTISSQLNFSTGRGPFSLNLGGTQQQYPGREAIDRTFPSLSITSKPITAGEWLTWTPSFTLTNTENLHIDRVGDFAFRYIPGPGGTIDSLPLDRNSRSTSMRFDTPVQIFGFRLAELLQPERQVQRLPVEAHRRGRQRHDAEVDARLRRTYLTEVDWQTELLAAGVLPRDVERVAVGLDPEGGPARTPRAIRANRKPVRRQLTAARRSASASRQHCTGDSRGSGPSPPSDTRFHHRSAFSTCRAAT